MMDVGGRCPERKHGYSSILITKDGTQEFVRESRVVALPVCPDADFEMHGCGLNAQMTFTVSDLLILSQVNAWPSLEVGGFPPGSPCCGV